MLIAVDFDGTIVEQDTPYEDLSTPLRFKRGAREALYSLKRAGHTLLLWSGRASCLLPPERCPLVRAGVRPLDRAGYEARLPLQQARYRQMLDFVQRNLPSVFAAIDDGNGGKPPVDLFIDDKALRLGSGRFAADWSAVAEMYGHVLVPAEEGMAYDAFSARFLEAGARPIGKTNVGPILMYTTAPRPRGTAIIIAGQHGEEQAGPLALYSYFEDILRYAQQLDVALRIYPCVNPEGFERVTRYNDAEQRPTNAALKYEVSPGEWVGELPPGVEPLQIASATEMTLETVALVASLSGVQVEQAVVLDLHQDSMVPAGSAFAYVFGRRSPYRTIMRAATKKPMKNTRLKNDSWTDVHVELRTDDNGLVEFFDGSVTDFLWRNGARMSLCLETSVKDMLTSIEISRRWIMGVIRAMYMSKSARLPNSPTFSVAKTA